MREKLAFLLFFMAHAVIGQTQGVLDNLPPSVKWKQINTAHFRIIYPEGFYQQGQRMANTMEHLYSPVAKTLGREPLKRTPIILQNRHAVANGFVTLGPRRSEFFTTSPQNPFLLGNNDWLDMLALHEYRHVVQYDRSRTGLTGLVYYVLGEFSQNAVASATVPSWFWEGDAVGVETAMSKSGRGRIPQFSQSFRANLLEKGSFTYSKQYLRSFKDFIPNHYVLGYHLNTYMRTKYGAEAVESMVDNTWRKPYIPFSHSFSMKKVTGKKMPAIYQDMMSDLKTNWAAQISKQRLTSFATVNLKRKKFYTDYNFPQLLDNGDIVALKSGLSDIPTLIVIDSSTGKEKRLFIPGPLNNAAMLSAQGSTIVWNEYAYDARWRTNTFSVIKMYNVATKKIKTLTTNSRYNAAALSPDRSKIVTIELLEDYSCSLVILDAFSGKVLKKISAEQGSLFSMPRWDENNSKIVMLNNQDGLKSIEVFDYQTGTLKVVKAAGEEHISSPMLHGNVVYYSSAYSGIDDIYALDLSSGRRYRVTSSKYGAYSPVITPDGKTMYYNNFTVDGNDVARISLDRSKWQPVDVVENDDIHYYSALIEQEQFSDILATVPDSVYKELPYRKKFLNVHSWGPIFTGDINSLKVGVFSMNVLSTTDLFLGYEFDNQGNGNALMQLSYQGLYPIIDLISTYGFRTANFPYTDSLDVAQNDRQTWNEFTVKVGPRIPWKLTNSRFHSSLEVRDYFGYTNVSNYSSTRLGEGRYFSQLNNGNLYQNEFRLLWSNQLKQSKRDIYSRWGQLLIFENFSTPFGGDFKGGITAMRAQLYFPGLWKHHSLNFLAGYQHQKVTLGLDEYWFSNRMPYPRGYGASIFEDFYTVRTNYALPLLHPDLRIGPWLYIQRIKASFFYDYGYGKTDVINRETNLQWQRQDYYGSTGVDLTFDFNVMRALPLLELGVRYVYIPESGSSQFEFLIGSLGF
jgi:hypothetical protein